MHSRIFKVYIPGKEELKDEAKIKENISELIGLNIEDDLLDSRGSTGMDWFDYRDNGQFKEDVDWFISAYTYSFGEEYKAKENNFAELDGQLVYELKDEEFKIIRDAIKKELDKRVEEVKKMLEFEDKNDYWFFSASRKLYPTNGFLFYIPGYGLVNDVEFYFAMKNAEKIYIVKSYDYHY